MKLYIDNLIDKFTQYSFDESACRNIFSYSYNKLSRLYSSLLLQIVEKAFWSYIIYYHIPSTELKIRDKNDKIRKMITTNDTGCIYHCPVTKRYIMVMGKNMDTTDHIYIFRENSSGIDEIKYNDLSSFDFIKKIDSKYSLVTNHNYKYNEHINNILLNLCIDGNMCDCIIGCKDRSIKANKYLLCSGSSYFLKIFGVDLNSTTELPEYTSDILKLYLKYKITRIITVTKDNLSQLIDFGLFICDIHFVEDINKIFFSN